MFIRTRQLNYWNLLVCLMVMMGVLFSGTDVGAAPEKSDNLKVEFSVAKKPLLAGFSTECFLTIDYRPDKIEIPGEYFNFDKSDSGEFSKKFGDQTIPFKDIAAPVVFSKDKLIEGNDYNFYGLNVAVNKKEDGLLRLKISYSIQLLQASVSFQPPYYIFLFPQFPYRDKTTSKWEIFREEKMTTAPVGAFGIMISDGSADKFKLQSLTGKIMFPEYDWKSNKPANAAILIALSLGVIGFLSFMLKLEHSWLSFPRNREDLPAERDIKEKLARCVREAEKKISALGPEIIINEQIHDLLCCLSRITKTFLHFKYFFDRELRWGIKSWSDGDIKKDLGEMLKREKISKDKYGELNELVNSVCLIYKTNQKISKGDLLKRLEMIKEQLK